MVVTQDFSHMCWYILFLDILEIPPEVCGEVLEERVLKIFGKLRCDISPDRIEACHRASRTTDTVIIKFSKRKDCPNVWSIKKDMKKLTMEYLELPGNSKLFINRSLCPHYKILSSKSKKRYSLRKIHSSPLSITHVDDFGKHFPSCILLMLSCHHRHAQVK